MSNNDFLIDKTEYSYISELTYDTIIFGENLFKVLFNKTKEKITDVGNNNPHNFVTISFCSDFLPFFCKSEVVHKQNLFKYRFGHSSILYKNSIYIFGGKQQVPTERVNFVKFDIDTYEFEALHNDKTPIGRYFFTLNLIHSSKHRANCFVLFGGKKNRYVTNDTYMYRIDKNSWEHLNPEISPPPLYGHVSFQYNNVILIHGGNIGQRNLSSNIWCYFEKENKWANIMSQDEYMKKPVEKPDGRFFHSCSLCVINQGLDVNVYFFGGLNKNNECVDDVFWLYSLNIGKWKQIKQSFGDVPSKRFGHSSIVIKDRWFLVYGGYSQSWYNKRELLDIHAYDIILNTWSKLKVYGMTLTTHHFYGGIVKVDESGYFITFGGLRDNAISSNVYKFTPLLITPYYQKLKNEIEEVNKKIQCMELMPRTQLSTTHIKEFDEIQEALNTATFTLSRYIQLIDDVNDKIRFSNDLAIYDNKTLSGKINKNYKYYESLIKRVEKLDKEQQGFLSYEIDDSSYRIS
ncbi:kelch domain-containing protein, putative [Hepatocystis sp. ex Piliocolobus tephrosceles]|nr:kelch domain-containing protein, putative [Hepatocystis sp. ex Piliocolobus tephrosceles]